MATAGIGILLTLAAGLSAQPNYQRSADLRIPTTESVMGTRKAWGVDAALGGSKHRGNVDLGVLNSSLQLFAARGPSTGFLAGRMVYHTLGGKRIQNQGRLALRYEHAVSGPWKAFVFNTSGYNEFLRLDFRNKTGAGPLYNLSLGPTRHSLSAAVAHVHEEFRNRVIERTARGVARWVGMFPVSSVARVETDFFYAPAVGLAGDYHFDTEVAFHTLWHKDKLGLRVSRSEEFDSRPKKGVGRSDTLWTTSLTLKLGR